MGFRLDCLDGVTGEGGKIVTQFSECVSQIVNLKMNFRETTRVPRCQYQDAAFERKAIFHQSTREAVEAATWFDPLKFCTSFGEVFQSNRHQGGDHLLHPRTHFGS